MICAIASSCNKNGDQFDFLKSQKELLAGTGSYLNSTHVWKFDSCTLDGVKQPLTTSQKSYKKSFSFDGIYFDTDNNKGYWEMDTLNKLRQIVTYQAINKIDTTSYDIVAINSYQLNLSYKFSNGKTGIYYFKISN